VKVSGDTNLSARTRQPRMAWSLGTIAAAFAAVFAVVALAMEAAGK